MKILLLFADASKTDKSGTVSVLGLGVSRVHLTSLPGMFSGSIIVAVELQQDDFVSAPHQWQASVTTPDGKELPFADGRINRRDNDLEPGVSETVVLAVPITMELTQVGDYVFHCKCASVESKVRVRFSSGVQPPAWVTGVAPGDGGTPT